MGVILVNQNGRGSRGQPLLNTDRVWHPNRHISEPGVVRESDFLLAIRVIVSISNHAVANHRAAKKLRSSILLCQGKLCHQASLRDPGHDTTLSAVRCFSYPPTECHFSPLDEIE